MTIEIIYRYVAEATATRPLPADSEAALLRLEQGNKSFATLLDHDSRAEGMQRIIPVDFA